MVNDAGDGVGAPTGHLTLRQAVNLANLEPVGTTIAFDTSSLRRAADDHAHRRADRADRQGDHDDRRAGAGGLTISGGGTGRVFEIAGGSATITDLTISGGVADLGAGLENDGGTLALINVTVSGNSASNKAAACTPAARARPRSPALPSRAIRRAPMEAVSAAAPDRRRSSARPSRATRPAPAGADSPASGEAWPR